MVEFSLKLYDIWWYRNWWCWRCCNWCYTIISNSYSYVPLLAATLSSPQLDSGDMRHITSCIMRGGPCDVCIYGLSSPLIDGSYDEYYGLYECGGACDIYIFSLSSSPKGIIFYVFSVHKKAHKYNKKNIFSFSLCSSNSRWYRNWLFDFCFFFFLFLRLFVFLNFFYLTFY